MWLIWMLAFTNAAYGAASTYCSVHTFISNSSYMQFTKDPIPNEYGFQGKYKSIHCCVKGSRSIEWFKDGAAYPWSANISNLFLSTQADNQTLITRNAAVADSGNYTCRLTNDTHSVNHTIRLQILDKPADTPKKMFVSKDQYLEEGSPLRLYCEALIPQSYLTDARSDLVWRKALPNTTEVDLPPSLSQTKTVREDVGNINGSYLVAQSLPAEDFGMYVCVIQYNDDVFSRSYVNVNNIYELGGGGRVDAEWADDSGVPWRTLVICAAGLTALLLTAGALHTRCTPRLLLAVRQARALTHTAAARARVLEKEFDVLVCWTAVDESLVRGALLPTLTLKYKYRVLALPVSTNPDTWYSEMVSGAARCRALVCVVSPAQHTAGQLLTALRQLRALPLPPVVVLLQDLPKLKREAKETGESLVGLLRRTRLVPWRHLHERDFWTSLRLALPIPPMQTCSTTLSNGKPTVVEENDPKNTRSGSMTALV